MQKSLKDIITTVSKRTPRYLRNRYLLSCLKNDKNFWMHLIPSTLNESLDRKIFNEKFILSSQSQKFYEGNFASSSLLSVSDSIMSGNYEIFGKKLCFVNSLPDWHHSIDIDERWPIIANNKINYHEYEKYGDPRYVWELNRLLHIVILSRAYWLTEDDKYSTRICSEIDSWIASNPFMYGINWVEGIEVGIRSINLIMAYNFIHSSSGFNRIRKKFIRSLYLHGRFIYENLSEKWSTNNNHIIAELTGLLFVGNFFHKFDFGQIWFDEATDKLIKELESQIMLDGFLWESSTAYHKFVTELVYISERLLNSHSNPKKGKLQAVLRNMLDALYYTIKPNGEICKIGDSDDAVALILSDKSKDYPDFLKSASISYSIPKYFFDQNPCEYSFWINGISHSDNVVFYKEEMKLFPESGLIFYNSKVKGKDVWLCFNIGNQNTKYIGAGHRHADILSILINVNGKDIITECGTYKYFDSLKIRNYFKSTTAHSTTNINDESQIIFKERFETARAKNATSELIHFNIDDLSVKGKHDGYSSNYSTTLEREISFDEKIVIKDSRVGPKNNLINVNFIIPSNVKLVVKNNQNLEFDGKYLLSINNNAELKIQEGYLSKNYGQIDKCKIVKFSASDSDITSFFRLIS